MQLLHTMIRVSDLERSVEFYTKVLGMRLLRLSDNPEYQYKLSFVGYGDENEGCAVVDLTYNYGVNSYEMGTAFGHLAIGVDDVAQTCEKIRRMRGKITREPGPVKGGTSIIAFIEDPDGYKIELLKSKKSFKTSH